jgi:hypothetical protein
MKITSLFSDKPYSAFAIAVCFTVMLILPWLHLLPVDSAQILLLTSCAIAHSSAAQKNLRFII